MIFLVSRDDGNMSKDRKEKYDAYGHLRKNIEEKQLQKGVNSSGTPKIVQVFLVSMLLSFIISEFYRFFKIGKNISPIYLNLEGIPKLACKNVSKWIDEYEEINLYMKKLNEDCRQLTCYEYYDMREFVALKEKEITDEEYEKYCKKIYQQDYSI